MLWNTTGFGVAHLAVEALSKHNCFSDKRLVAFRIEWKHHQPFATSPATSFDKQRQVLWAGKSKRLRPERLQPAYSDQSQHDASVLFDESREIRVRFIAPLAVRTSRMVSYGTLELVFTIINMFLTMGTDMYKVYSSF